MPDQFSSDDKQNNNLDDLWASSHKDVLTYKYSHIRKTCACYLTDITSRCIASSRCCGLSCCGRREKDAGICLKYVKYEYVVNTRGDTCNPLWKMLTKLQSKFLYSVDFFDPFFTAKMKRKVLFFLFNYYRDKHKNI